MTFETITVVSFAMSCSLRPCCNILSDRFNAVNLTRRYLLFFTGSDPGLFSPRFTTNGLWSNRHLRQDDAIILGLFSTPNRHS